MKPFRVSIAAFLGAIAVLAVGFMGLREGTELWAFVTFVIALLFLIGATLTSLLRPVEQRAGWTGFAVVGWVYFGLNFGPWTDATKPPRWDGTAMHRFMNWVHPDPQYEDLDYAAIQEQRAILEALSRRLAQRRLKPGSVAWPGDATHFYQTAHAMGTLFFGAIGAAWGRWLVRRSPPRLDRQPTPAPPPNPADDPTEPIP